MQEAYDRPGLHCDVFEGKHLALKATLQSGTFFRNLGRPVLDPAGKATVERADGHGSIEVDRYVCPLETRGGGHLIGGRENQRGGYEHFHYTRCPRDVKSELELLGIDGGVAGLALILGQLYEERDALRAQVNKLSSTRPVEDDPDRQQKIENLEAELARVAADRSGRFG